MSKLLEILSVARLQSHLDWPCQTVQPVHNTHSCACVCVWTKSKPNTVKLAQRKNGDTLALASFPFPLSASHTNKCHLTPLLLMYVYVRMCVLPTQETRFSFQSSNASTKSCLCWATVYSLLSALSLYRSSRGGNKSSNRNSRG